MPHCELRAHVFRMKQKESPFSSLKKKDSSKNSTVSSAKVWPTHTYTRTPAFASFHERERKTHTHTKKKKAQHRAAFFAKKLRCSERKALTLFLLRFLFFSLPFFFPSFFFYFYCCVLVFFFFFNFVKCTSSCFGRLLFFFFLLFLLFVFLSDRGEPTSSFLTVGENHFFFLFFFFNFRCFSFTQQCSGVVSLAALPFHVPCTQGCT